MFDTLSGRFEAIFTKLKGRGRLGESEVNEALREIRLALLEADVNFDVVKAFVGRVRQRCLDAELSKSLSPAQQVVKIVSEELKVTLGGQSLKLTYASRPPTVVLLAGLQGSGKTTAAAKLARWFKRAGRNPLLVGADLQRPAAIDQLGRLGEQVGVPMYSHQPGGDPVATARDGVEQARDRGRDVCVVDTAGRLAVDAEMMEQVRHISDAVEPDYTFLVVDAMTGQDAVNVAESFHATLEIDGVILSKVDGDARGGAALSVKEVIGRPIAFASTGERVADFELFHPDRMADRILGMGDVLTLIDKVEEEYDQDVAVQAQQALLEGQFTLDDFLEQMQQIRKMGPLQGVLGMIPGVPKELKNAEIGEDELGQVEAIIRSMTPQERQRPDIMNGSRRSRVAQGSGTSVSEVNLLLNQFKQMAKMMKRMGGGARKAKRGGRRPPALPDLAGLGDLRLR